MALTPQTQAPQALDTPRTEYNLEIPRWQKCRDVMAGSDAVKARGVTYLDRLGGQTDDEYKAYQRRALFYNGCERTRSSLVGLVFAKAPVVDFPDDLKDHLDDVTLDDTNLEALASSVVEEILEVGRYGILVDMAPESSAEQRPYWVRYRAEDILNWSTVRLGGDMVLSLVVLREKTCTVDPATFVMTETERFRVLDLVDLDTAPKYRVRLYKRADVAAGTAQTAKRELVQDGTDLFPHRDGTALDFIPFTFIGPTSLSSTIAKPPMIDMIEVNLSHYRSSADLEHGRHFTALPTPWVVGAPSEGELRIGAGVAWTLEGPNAKAGMLEFTGQGLGALSTALEQKQEQMAQLGASIVNTPASNETAEAVRAKQASAFATLSTIARTVSDGLTKCLRWHAWWLGKPDASLKKIQIALNRTFISSTIDAQTIATLLTAVQAGKMSFETFYWNLQRGEMAQPEVEADTERERIAADEALDPQPDPVVDPNADPNPDPNRPPRTPPQKGAGAQ